MKKSLILFAALAAMPGVAAAQQSDEGGARLADAFAGPRIEARLGWETPTVSGDGEVYKIDSAISYGAEAGFDVAAGNNVVVGPYATYEFSNVDVCEGTDCVEIDDNIGLGLRVGYVASPSTMIYARAGYARMKISATDGLTTESVSEDGIQGALGLEQNFGPMVYGRIEANYADYGDFVGINLQRRHVVAGIGLRF